jgi:hypothetical protein
MGGTDVSIVLSEKHGVNPAIAKCFLCGEDKNEILLLGKLKGDVEAPKNVVFDYEPCDKCKDYMKQGIILISVDEEKSKNDHQNPYRTGGWVVVSDDYIKRVVDPPLRDTLLKKRVGFVPDEAWEMLGLKQ